MRFSLGSAWRRLRGARASRIGSDQQPDLEGPDMDHSVCGSGALWCDRTDRIVEGMYVLKANVIGKQLVLDV